MRNTVHDTVAGVLAVTLGLLFWTWHRKKPAFPLPPGPRKLPIIGNLLDVPTSFEWETFERWGKEYGSDVVHCSAAGTSLVILNSVKAANDLLDKRSAIYSNRPTFALINRMMGWSWLMPFLPYGAAWKERRRFFQRHLGPSSVTVYKPHQLEYTHQLLQQLLETPESYLDHIKHSIGGILCTIAYGTKCKPVNDPYITLAEKSIQYLADTAVPMSMVFDAMPFLIPILSPLLPAAPFKKTKKQWRELNSQFRDDPFLKVQKLISEGPADPTSLVARGLEDSKTGQEGDEHLQEIIKDVAGVLFVGGSSTTNVIIQSFVLAMLCFPDVQKKAQQEIDRVVGRNRLPDFNDEVHMPYLEAVLKEVQRWKPPGPLGIPHRVDKDDVYEGYLIPANSTATANAWAMLHNETEYPDPDPFNPERFLKDGHPDPSVRDPSTVSFGFGRRACPGTHIALSAIWITAASILWAFDITKPVDENGDVIEPMMEYHSAITLAPVPFKCVFRPRQSNVEALIRSQNEQF